MGTTGSAGGLVKEMLAEDHPGLTEDKSMADPISAAHDTLAESHRLVGDARRLLAEARQAQRSTGYRQQPAQRKPPAVQPHTRRPAARHRRHRTARPVARLMMSIPAATGLVLLGVAVGQLSGNPSMPDLAGRATVPAHVAGAGGAAPAASPPVSVPNASLQAPPPLWISVPRFGGRAPVTGEVAIQTSGPEKGLLDAPPNYHDLGWFRDGGSGLLVIDGHVGYRTDPGPLAFIGQLSDGDRVLVGTEKGTGAFVVTAVARAVKGQLPPQYFTPAFDGDLMLITCDYTSPFSAGHFADNVYVVAVPQP